MIINMEAYNMAKARITEVMMDDTSINVSKEVDLVFSIANSLRGAYKSDKYKDVIIPMIIIRRFECALARTKKKVVEAFEARRDIPPQILEKTAGFRFYNTSRFTLAELLNDADNIVSNFKSYIEGFSANVQSIIRNLDFEKEIDKMDKNNRLLGVVRKSSELDLNPNTIDGIKAGYMFEEIIRKFSENAEAGDHYTPREVIRLLVSVLLAEGLDDLYTERRVATVLDMACGSGGMLSTTHDAITRMNPDAEVRLFGQEINPESYAICLADMLIKGEDAKNIRLQDTMKADCFEGQDMRIVIINPPFGQAWGGKDAADGVESAVKKEHKKAEQYDGTEKMKHSRFPWGLPTSGDMQLLFMQHAIKKLSKDGRAAIISNGSPLFSGNTTSGESQIRRHMLENDLIEAIIALPTDLFYNTSIGIYAFIFSKDKRPERRGKIQLINAVDMFKPLRKSLGKKRKEISKDDIAHITEIYSEFSEGAFCKIFDNKEFMYKEYAVYQPLQRRGSISAVNIAALKTSVTFTANPHIFNEADYEVLLATAPREGDDERKFQKYQKGKEFTEAVIAALEKRTDGTEYDDFAKFVATLKEIIGDIKGMTDSRLNAIAMDMSVMDKTAVVQKDKKGNVIPDPTTKDTELIGLKIDVEDYFQREVYPHVPDAIYAYEYDENKKTSAINKEKLGAEFPFTRYFYEYKAPEKADDLLARFAEIESGLDCKVSALLGGAK
jgi:type I restriction enzyme M protein